jgi:hypothetical protein
MQLTHVLFLAGALGASAHPSAHGHLHRASQVKRDGAPVFLRPVRPAIVAPTPKVEAVPTPSAAPKAVPSAPSIKDVPKESESNNGKGKGNSASSYIPFCSEGGPASKKAKRVTLDQIRYTGNLGTANGCPWNSNMMVVPNEIADKYKYVQKFENVDKVAYQVICANKMGADGQNTGSFVVEGQEPLTFTVQPGETKTVVDDKNTQGICAWAPNKVPVTPYGQLAGVWGEFDAENASNDGWSGADCSSLVAQAYDMDVPGCRMSHGGVNSDILPGGIGNNAYTKGMEALDGIGLNINKGDWVINVYLGFSG